MPDLSYDQIDALVDVDPIALRDVAWKLTQDVARLEAERDAMRGVVEAVRALHKPTLQTVEWFHDQTGKGEALCCPSCRPEEPSEWDPPIGWAGVEPEGFVPSYTVSPCPTLAAVDQTAPSSPLETPQTADDGEAGVVEGAGGSEAAEGEQVAAWELQAINDEYARRMAAAPRRPEGRTPLSRERATALVGSNTRVRVWLNYAGPGDEGVVIGYLDRPSVIIQRPDGSQSSWSIDLDYEELGTDA